MMYPALRFAHFECMNWKTGIHTGALGYLIDVFVLRCATCPLRSVVGMFQYSPGGMEPYGGTI